MAADTYVNVGGTWQTIGASGIYTRVSGVWQPVTLMYARVAGVWQQVYIQDNVGPGAPTNMKVSFVSNGSVKCEWNNPADADFSHVQISAKYSDNSGTILATTTISGTPSQAKSTTQLCPSTGKVVRYTLTPYDVNGNPGATYTVDSHAWSGTARGRVASPSFFVPTDSGTYRNSGWRTDVGNRLYQGTTSNGTNYGTYFYGTQIFTTLHGSAVTAGNIMIKRVNSGGLGGAVYPDVWWSDISSQASSPIGHIFNEKLDTGSPLCRNGSCPTFDTITFPSTWLDNISDPAQTRLRSIVFYSATNDGDPSSTYMQLYGYDEAPGDVFPGVITITHGG